MKKLKELIKEAEYRFDWDELRRDMEAESGEDYSELEGVAVHYHFETWDHLERVLMEIAGKGFLAGIDAITSEEKKPFSKWYDEYIETIKP